MDDVARGAERASEAALLPIGAVVAALAPEFPDVTPSSLRFLEREGLLVPRRTPGGHRLYGAEHLERLRRIKQWQRARLSLAEIRERLLALDRLPATDLLATSFLDQALAGRAAEARRTILEAIEAGLPLERLFEEVLRPALHRLGDRWAAGQLSVGQEHEVSAIARDVVGEVAARLPGPRHDRGVVVAACPAGERHDLGLRMTAALWAAEGYRVHFLGADVPVESILDAVLRRGAGVLLLSAATEGAYPALQSAVQTVGALPEGVRPRLIVGGQAVAAHAEALRALGAEPRASDGPDRAAAAPIAGADSARAAVK